MTRWNIDIEEPDRDEKYKWRAPNNEDQHVERSNAPGDLNIKPGDMAVKPTFPPSRTGIQSGENTWNFVDDSTSDWYINIS